MCVCVCVVIIDLTVTRRALRVRVGAVSHSLPAAGMPSPPLPTPRRCE